VLSTRRTLAGVLLALLVAVALVPASASAVAAAGEGCQLVEAGVVNGQMTYKTVCPGDESEGPGEPGDGGSGSGGTPACDLSAVENVADFPFCVGTTACAVNNPSHLDPAEWPEETRPSPTAIYTWRWCETAAGTVDYVWTWYEPEVEGPSLTELAMQAFGALATPGFSVQFNPPGRAVVGVPTWFWAGTGNGGALTGSSAAGVVAIAEPSHLEVDPGDGSGTRTCPWSTSKSDACSATYDRASVRDGAYTARARLVYDVRFENNGAPLDLPGLPTALESPWATASVPVAEVQAVVTRSP